MNKPFFSVVIPTYNRADILPRSIDSVLCQTYQDFELIVVDNGSDDHTQQKLKEAYQDRRLIYHYQLGSGSPASPRNTGISLAKGQWVCLLDSDDKWHEDKLQSVFNAIQNNVGAQVVCHNEWIYDEKTGQTIKLLKYGPTSKEMYKDMLMFGNRLSTSATSIKVDFLKKYDLKFNESKELATVEDYDLWLNMARNRACFVFLPDSLGFYTVSESNMIGNSLLFCENLHNLLKMHVFHIQTFEKDKHSLWELLVLRYSICKIQYIDDSLFRQIISFFLLLVRQPVNLFKLIFGYSKRKLQFIASQ